MAALILKDRVQQTTLTTGTGPYALTGAVAGYQLFSAVLSVGDTFWGAIVQQDSDWLTGLFTYSAANQVTVTTVFESSNANAAVNFTSGLKSVFIDLPASRNGVPAQKAVTASGDVTIADTEPADTIKINNTSGAPINVFLPSAAVRAKRIRVVDVGFNAGTNAITVKPKAASGQTIMGGTAYPLSSNGASLELEPNSDGTGYF